MGDFLTRVKGKNPQQDSAPSQNLQQRLLGFVTKERGFGTLSAVFRCGPMDSKRVRREIVRR
jgi:hypothetical protein